MMHGVRLTPLKHVPGAAGDVRHALKASSSGYAGFGEAYFSEIHEGAIKSWRRHLRFTINLVVPRGNVRFVFRDSDGSCHEHEIGERNFARLTIEPGIWFAFKGLGPGTSLILDIMNGEHDPDETEVMELAAVGYDW